MLVRDARPEDVEAVFELLSARSRAAFGVSQVERTHVEASLRNDESWVAADGAALAGHASLAATQTLTLAAVDPAVGDELLERALAGARDRGFDHVVVDAVPEDRPLWSLVERAGFTHERDVLRMWRSLEADLPAPAWPADVRVRTYHDADGERVHALLDEQYAGWDATYVRISHPDWLVFMTEHDEFDPALWLLVERDGDLVACALHWKEHQGRGWVKDIVVRESERGRGLGKALLHEAFRAYRARGVERVGLKVDSTNPSGALQLYERVGFVVDQRLAIWTKRL